MKTYLYHEHPSRKKHRKDCILVLLNSAFEIGGASIPEVFRLPRWRRIPKRTQEQASAVYGNGHTTLYADVIDAIANDRAPYVDAKAGRDALEVVLAIYKSQKTGLPVGLPLNDFASADMAGEFQ